MTTTLDDAAVCANYRSPAATKASLVERHSGPSADSARARILLNEWLLADSCHANGTNDEIALRALSAPRAHCAPSRARICGLVLRRQSRLCPGDAHRRSRLR
jgi:hypothetical protein